MTTTTEMQHTQGPWTADNGNTDQWGVFGSDGRVIAWLGEFDGFGQMIVKGKSSDASLIAAAPELLAVAAYFDYAYNEADSGDVASLDDDEVIEIRVTGRSLKDARAAIAKATS